MQGERRPLYASRLNRDLSELFAYNFACPSSTLSVILLESDMDLIAFSAMVHIFEGPYTGGSFEFTFTMYVAIHGFVRTEFLMPRLSC